MLSQQQALEYAKEMRLADFGRRAAMEVQCAVAMALAFSNNQWVHAGTGRNGGYSVNGLRPMLQMTMDQVRVSLNQIRPRLRQACSKLMPDPDGFDYDITPASPQWNDLSASRVGKARLDIHLDRIQGIRKLRRRTLLAATLGSALIRRVIRSREMAIMERDNIGEPIIDPKTGKPKFLREFDHDWMVCPPYEFIRSPGANSVDFDGEDCIGHEKPITTDELYRRFGIKLQTSQTYGQLLDFQQKIAKWAGTNAALGLQYVNRPAVMLQEWWFKGIDLDPENKWPYMLVTYCDDKAVNVEDRDLKVLYYGRNPYGGLPIHHFFYDPVPELPWGQGLVEQVMQEQHLYNVAVTGLLRTYLEQGGSKYVVEQNSISDPIQEAFSKRNSVIQVQKGAVLPKRLEPPSLDQHCVMFVQSATDYFDNALNQNPVQRGVTSKRGDAVGTVKLKIEQADSTNAARIADDQICVNSLLTGTLSDLGLIARLSPTGLKTTKILLGNQFDDLSIQRWMDQDWQDPSCGVRVTRDSMSPKTPREYRDEYVELTREGILDKDRARIAILLRGGERVDPFESAAWEKQESEIQSILSGQEIEVSMNQRHEVHLLRLAYEEEQPRYETYSKEQKKALEEHSAMHREMKILNAQYESMGATPQEAGAGEMPGAQSQIVSSGQDTGQGYDFQDQAAADQASPAAPAMGESAAGPTSDYETASVV